MSISGVGAEAAARAPEGSGIVTLFTAAFSGRVGHRLLELPGTEALVVFSVTKGVSS